LWNDPDFKFVYYDYLIANFPEGGVSTQMVDVLFESERDQLFKRCLKPAAYYRYLNRTRGLFAMTKRFIQNK
ncbi:MAG: hypothetical protein ACHQIM_11385, partial [Sphingobacteriales bacterium]